MNGHNFSSLLAPLHPRPDVMARGRDAMLESLMVAVERAGGSPNRFIEDVANGMSVLALCETLGTNDVRFVHAPGFEKSFRPPVAVLALGEFTMLAEGGAVKSVALNGQPIPLLQKCVVEAEADRPVVVHLSFFPSESYPSIP